MPAAQKSWAKSIDANNVTLLTKITFQGRHMIEEGCEFSADIDLLTEHPFFETNVYAGDETDAEIAQVINRELASYLWLMAQYAESRPVLSAGHLCELASIFVQNMHRDAGGFSRENALPLRMALSLLF
ncbi:hypothetical protein Slin15195_G028710 [Septoria linicola]|uniref:Uncharacterized protein n=1 Tax=Septoria linicola TaxID=215465 RepID=A0A9Q9AHX2_9PEZI|nr:hypothetical protein Slin14017_G027750 [Septoria linicola]USW49552.1 hypothetical protein Slin15195_G028710 [Septoria linicola]